MIAPALTSISSDLNITNEVEAQLTLSIFVLAYAIGPLFLGPLSEIYGRVIVLQLSNLFYLAWNLGCGFAQTSGQLMAFRFLSGLGGSAPLAIGGVSCVVGLWCLWLTLSGRSQRLLSRRPAWQGYFHLLARAAAWAGDWTYCWRIH